MEEKATNPKDVIGVKKVPVSVIPSPAILELGLALMAGARKYGRHNYRVAKVRFSVYYDAAMRHLMAAWEGEELDPESGLPHLAHVMACMAILIDARSGNFLVDDRPPSIHTEGWVQELNEEAARLIELYPDAAAPVTRKEA